MRAVTQAADEKEHARLSLLLNAEGALCHLRQMMQRRRERNPQLPESATDEEVVAADQARQEQQARPTGSQLA